MLNYSDMVPSKQKQVKTYLGLTVMNINYLSH